MLIKDLPIGAKIKLGKHQINNESPQQIEWLVAAHEHEGYPIGSTTLVTKDIIDLRAFDGKEPRANDSVVRSGGSNDYGRSNIKQWLNKSGRNWYVDFDQWDSPPSNINIIENKSGYEDRPGFLTFFEPRELALIKNTPTRVGYAMVDGNYGSVGRIFLLSQQEIGFGAQSFGRQEGHTLPLFENPEYRLAKVSKQVSNNSDFDTPAGISETWWLRTPASSYRYIVVTVSMDNGTLVRGASAANGEVGLRPALNIDWSKEVSSIPDSEGAYTLLFNVAPTLLDTTPNNKIFYEGDTINLNGLVTDTDVGNIMSVKYKINNGTTRAIATGISDGITPLAYSKTLTFTLGKLLDGTTEVATGLIDGQTYKITLWAEDDQGGKSTEIVRNFTVVPNRPPVLSIDPITPQLDKINSEVLTLNGKVTDADNNDVVVSLRINDNSSIQIYSGEPSNFTTDIKIANLKEGNNTITITAKDTFDFVTTKTVTIKKTRDDTKLNKGVARYKVNPPSGNAKQILAWIQKDVGDLIVDADVSMVLKGENENYAPMSKLTAPINENLEEDEFSHEVESEKDNITLKLKLYKTDTLSDKSIKQISGVLK